MIDQVEGILGPGWCMAGGHWSELEKIRRCFWLIVWTQGGCGWLGFMWKMMWEVLGTGTRVIQMRGVRGRAGDVMWVSR